jgi:hypothetical protein
MKPVVQTPDEILSVMPKPQLVTVDRFPLSEEDWLVVCGGFEDRALAFLKSAVASKTNFNVVLVLYEPFVAQNRVDDIRTICRNAGIRVVELSYNRQEPAGFGNTLVKTLPVNCGQVFIDISGMSPTLDRAGSRGTRGKP